MAIWLIAGNVYFGAYGRHHLVRSLEDEFALTELAKEAKKKTGG